MNDIELICFRPQRLLLHKNEWRVSIDQTCVKPKRMRESRFQSRRCMRISTGKKRHVMTLADEFFREIGHHPLGAPVQTRWYAFPERSNLCDFHINRPFK